MSDTIHNDVDQWHTHMHQQLYSKVYIIMECHIVHKPGTIFQSPPHHQINQYLFERPYYWKKKIFLQEGSEYLLNA